jgi:hypothetical protein
MSPSGRIRETNYVYKVEDSVPFSENHFRFFRRFRKPFSGLYYVGFVAFWSIFVLALLRKPS